jgi:glycerate kinase
MHVLIAPDSFKGTLSARAAADAIRRGVEGSDVRATVRCLPLSDGGEGFASVLIDVLGGELREATVPGPLGEPTRAAWTLLGGGRVAVIETAQAIGLHLVGRPAPLETTTAGVGELVRRALDAGATTIALGLGGSATTDGGAGAAEALGVEFRTAGKGATALRGGRLRSVQSIDARGRDPRLGTTTLIALTDVDNPLTGPEGAARAYGPQKGASPADVAELDRALVHLSTLAGDPGRSPGDGAAGGLGYGLRVLLGARLSSGIEFVLDRVGFDRALDGADLVITGEGRLDAQTTRGKVVAGVVARCRARRVPVIALVGSATEGAEAMLAHGLDAYYTLCDESTTEHAAMAHAAPLLEALARDVMNGRVLK